ncbi:DNA polymerase III subunit gamma and tau [Nocardia seriolae]|uniref:DNA polymerase III subunit gamma and tau n=2 Tax=Nocardia seriolae TaxID=37332 RepID=UPI002E37ED2E|nr:DNA polymerase III subunit gamma and tau [Nocardia seriolae]
MALYRKYRPATFAEVVGQEHVTDPLSIALDTGRISHAYLFSGPRGCGKTSSARILARSLNCVQGPTAKPCGVCSSCVALGPGGSGNLDVIELDAASHGGVDDTRELRDRAFYAPAESRYRVFIVDEAHMVTTAGFNALLKIVEEPPAHLIFVFATTEPDKVLPTIRSRTHHYPFRLLPPATMRGLLGKICDQENVQFEESVYPLVIRAGGGSPRDSLSVLDQLLAGAGPEGVTYPRAVSLLGVTDVALIDDAIDALADSDGAALFSTIDHVVEAGHDPRRFATDLLERLRDLILLRAVPDATDRNLVTGPGDVIDRMHAQAERLGPATLARHAELLHEGLGDMRGATNPRLLLEVIAARMLLPAASTAETATLQRLEQLERGIAGGTITSAPRQAAPAQQHAQVAPQQAPATPAASAAAAAPQGRRGAAALAAMRAEKSCAPVSPVAETASAQVAQAPAPVTEAPTPANQAPAPVTQVPPASAAANSASQPPVRPTESVPPATESAAASSDVAAPAASAASGNTTVRPPELGPTAGAPTVETAPAAETSAPAAEASALVAQPSAEPAAAPMVAAPEAATAPDMIESPQGLAAPAAVRPVSAAHPAERAAAQQLSAGATAADREPVSPEASVEQAAPQVSAPVAASEPSAPVSLEPAAVQPVSHPNPVAAEPVAPVAAEPAAPVAAEPAVAAVEVPAAGGDAVLAEIEAAWADIRAKVREFGAAVHALLSGASVARVEGETIVFAHQHAPLAQRLSQPQYLEAVQSAVKAVLGREHGVKWEVGGAGSGGAVQVAAGRGPAAAAPAPAAPKKAAQKFSRPSQAKAAAAAPVAEPAPSGWGSPAPAAPAAPAQPATPPADSGPAGGDPFDSGAARFAPPEDDIPLPDGPDLPDDPGPGDYSPVGYDGVPPATTPEEEREMLEESAKPVPPEERRDPDEVALALLRSELGATPLEG